MNVARAAVAAVARSEWSGHRRATLAIGLAAGLLCGVVVAGVAVARRTATAPDRLYAAVAPGDARVQLFGRSGVDDRIVDAPMVERSWRGGLTVARLDGDVVQYVGMVAPLSADAAMVRPVVVDGRTARADVATEATVTEQLADRVGIRPGDVVRVSVLTPLEITQFDTGFGEPDGPTVDLSVVGVVRVPPDTFESSPVLLTPAFAQQYPEVVAGVDVFADLVGGQADRPAFAAAVDRIVGSGGTGEALDDFLRPVVTDPHDGTGALERASSMLVGGLVVALAVGALAVALGLSQALSRVHLLSAGAQHVERALGMTTGERVLARAIAVVPAAIIAGALTAVVGATGSFVEPLGGARAVEPHPGWRADVPVVVVGAGVAVALVLGLAVVSAARVVRAGEPSPARARRGALDLVPRRRGWPLAGVAFAVSPGAGRHPVPVRTSVAACVVGVAVAVAAATVGSSLDRLRDTPERYGWAGDVAVIDTTDEIAADLAGDARLVALTDVRSSDGEIGGIPTQVYSFTPMSGDLMWTITSGRRPVSDDEVVLGTKLASRLDAGVGDRITASGGPPGGLRVVGLGFGPVLSNETFAASALAVPVTVDRLGAGDTFRETLVDVATGEDVDAVVADLAARYELAVRDMPAEVRNVVALGRLPDVLGAFVAGVALLALAHALVLVARHRAPELAVIRAIGATPLQTGLAVVATSMATMVVAVAAGVPIGLLIARLVWGEIARSVGFAGDVAVGTSVLAIPVVALALAVVIAIAPARRVMRAHPGPALRTE